MINYTNNNDMIIIIKLIYYQFNLLDYYSV